MVQWNCIVFAKTARQPLPSCSKLFFWCLLLITDGIRTRHILYWMWQPVDAILSDTTLYVPFYMYKLSEYILTNVGYLRHMVWEEWLQIKASQGCQEGWGGGRRSDIKAGPTWWPLQEIPCKERIVPYTDALFRKAAIEWLVATDQVIISCAVYYVQWLNWWQCFHIAYSSSWTPNILQHGWHCCMCHQRCNNTELDTLLHYLFPSRLPVQPLQWLSPS